MLFEPSALDREEVQEEIAKNKYHIYLVCKRKKMFFMGTESDGPDYNKTAFYWLDDDHEKIPVGYRHQACLRSMVITTACSTLTSGTTRT